MNYIDNIKSLFFTACIVLCIFPFTISAQDKEWIDFNKNNQMDIFENPNATIDNRVNNLLSSMDIEEKMLLLREVSPAIPRLGIPKYDHGNEALHGVCRPGKFTVFPQAIGLASTWNPILIEQVSTTISDEARAKWNALNQGVDQKEKYTDLLTFWSPTVNMARDPRWGRTPETYGEDPYLSSRIGVAFVKGLQGYNPRYLKVVSTPKHFAGNNEEHNRFECQMNVSEMTLRNYYLPAFKSLITEGKAESIMTAYNSINGVPCTANKWLLSDILRGEWGFNGYVVSDCGAPGFIYSNHNYTDTREMASAKALRAGLDLECAGYCDDCFLFTDYLPIALDYGLISLSEVNMAAFRVLRARFKLGIFDPASLNPYTKIDPSVIGSVKHQIMALEAAKQSIVLMKNDNNILPLDKNKVSKIAVLGINAATCEFGDYSGKPVIKPVSPLQGIINKVGSKAKILTLPWIETPLKNEVVHSNFFEDIKNTTGLFVEYYTQKGFLGNPVTSKDNQIDFNPSNQAPNPIIPRNVTSIRWSGMLVPPVDGIYKLNIETNGNVRLYIDDVMVINRWDNFAAPNAIQINLEQEKKYRIKYEFEKLSDNIMTNLQWIVPTQKKEEFAEEVKIAKQSDVVIAVLGTNKTIEKEGMDRTTLNLPPNQMQFIQQIFKVNKNIIVVLVSGSSLAINWIDSNIPAIINAWYPGEQGGTVIADVLFGDYNPGGKLPITYYQSQDNLLPFNDYEISNGRTYMYCREKPLYPFGHGLSYSTFKYESISASAYTIKRNETIHLTAVLKNTSGRYGSEVVQLYVINKNSKDFQPLKQLKGFKRVWLNPNESKTVSFDLNREDLSYWNKLNQFVLDSGEYEIQVGSSSEDIKSSMVIQIL